MEYTVACCLCVEHQINLIWLICSTRAGEGTLTDSLVYKFHTQNHYWSQSIR